MKKLLSFSMFAVGLCAVSSAHALSDEAYQKLDILASVFDRIQTSYVEPVSDTKVIESAINGMLTSLDPHSSYLSVEDFKEMREQTSGKFGGLGIEVTMEKGAVKVISPIDDTPAAKAGLESGDYIIRINNDDVSTLSLSDAVSKMRGAPGSPVTLKIYRESTRKTFDVTLKRDVIVVKAVKSHMEKDGIGYIRLTTFNEQLDGNMQKALSALVKENGGKDLSGLVLDLRNNPGGLLNQAISVSDAFLEKGEVVSTRGRIQGQNQHYYATAGDIMKGRPVVVLINGGTASAAEIVSGALQDHKRALVVGTKSFGKGSVQSIIPLPGGAGMRLTTALYYTPSGRSIQAEGIAPDVLVKPGKVEEFDDSNMPTEASLKGHILQPNGNGNGKAPVKTQVKEPSFKDDKVDDVKAKDAVGDKNGKDAKTDYQLERALGIIKALSIWNKK